MIRKLLKLKIIKFNKNKTQKDYKIRGHLNRKWEWE